MLSAPATIPATSARNFAVAFAPPRAAMRSRWVSNVGQPATGGQRQHRGQPTAGHEIRIVEPHRHRAAGVG